MKPILIILLCLSGSLVAQDYRQAGEPKDILEEYGTVHAMGRSGRGHVLAVGETLRADTDDDKVTDGFVSHYDDVTGEFRPKPLDVNISGAIHDVCPDSWGGAWLVGHQTTNRGLRQGVVYHMYWDEEFSSYEEDDHFSPEERKDGASLRFTSVKKLLNGSLLLGGEIVHEKSGRKGRIEPVLYLFKKREFIRIVENDLTVGRSARVTELFINSAEDQAAVIVEHLDDNGESEQQYQEFLLQLPPDATPTELRPRWRIGAKERITCNGFSQSVEDEIVASGVRWSSDKGEPWLSISPMGSTAMQNLEVNSAHGNPILGGSIVLREQIATVSGASVDAYRYLPEYYHFEEFPYVAPERAYGKDGLKKMEVSLAAFYGVDFFEDGDNLWLYGQHDVGFKDYVPKAIRLEAVKNTLSRSLPQNLLEKGQLTIEDMIVDFGDGDTFVTPAARRGRLRLRVVNNGPTIHQLKAQLSILGQAKGIQFLSREPLESQSLKGIGAQKFRWLTFLLETTEELSVESGARFIVQIKKDNEVLAEKERAIRAQGNIYEGFELVIEAGFGKNTTVQNPVRADQETRTLTTIITSTRPLQGEDIIIRNRKAALNKGRGKYMARRPISATEGSYVYEISMDVKLDKALNEISFDVIVDGEKVAESETQYILYSELPTLHYIGVAPDYAAIGASNNAPKLDYNQQDVFDVSDELLRSQGEGKMYGLVVPTLLTGMEETTTSSLREFFGGITKGRGDPTRKEFIAEDDLVIVHFAAHGGLRGKDYCLIPSDYDPENSAKIIDYKREILKPLLRLDRRILILIDACHDPLADPSRGIGADSEEIVPRLYELHRDATGVVTFVAASEGERAYEHKKWKNGLFTEALLEAIRGDIGFDEKGRSIQADRMFTPPPDGIITIGELSRYLNQRVPGLIQQTDGLNEPQHPTLITDPDSKMLSDSLMLFRLPEKIK